jgi:tRNA dimethylallyltransferase
MTIRKSVVVLGPTASGKSDAAMTAAALQPKGSVHVIAADSMQVYKRMDIGTAKPSAADQALITHHCLDVAEPSERYTVARYMEDVAVARQAIADAGAAELVVGGTGLYVTAIVDGLDMPGEFPEIRSELEANEDTEVLFTQLLALDPEATTKMEPNNRRRIIRALEVCLGSGEKFSSFGEGIGSFSSTSTTLIGLRWDRDVLRSRIAQRVNIMMERGLVEEVGALLAEPDGLSFTARQLKRCLQPFCVLSSSLFAKTAGFVVTHEFNGLMFMKTPLKKSPLWWQLHWNSVCANAHFAFQTPWPRQ